MTGGTRIDLQGELAALASLNRAELVDRWTAAFGCPAPHRSGATFLRCAVAWHLQMQIQPGVRLAAKRTLRTLHLTATSQWSAVLSPGTRLFREWQGRAHHVTVLLSGFEYEGERYRSLTAIARRITGTAWSGPLFFDLRS